MERCGDAVYRLACCRLGSRADAEDVYQEVFLRLMQDTTAFPRRGAPQGVAAPRDASAAAPTCAARPGSGTPRRSRPRRTPLRPVPDDHERICGRPCARLPDDLRTAVWLHYVEGYRTDEIAELVGCRPATVRTRLHRARKQLKLDLEGSDDEQPEQLGTDEAYQSAR